MLRAVQDSQLTTKLTLIMIEKKQENILLKATALTLCTGIIHGYTKCRFEIKVAQSIDYCIVIAWLL